MSLRSSVANGGVEKTTSKSPSDGGQEKQKKLLEADAGHFSMIKALHLADLITELNGTVPPSLQKKNNICTVHLLI
ncbi:MAG: hypothetical protein Q9194_001003 [Teloschistes cf. exilis]